MAEVNKLTENHFRGSGGVRWNNHRCRGDDAVNDAADGDVKSE